MDYHIFSDPLLTHCDAGVYTYLEELWRKKQSETMRFLLRMRAWEYRQKTAIHRCPAPSRPDKARRLGYKAKQVRMRMRCETPCCQAL